MAGTSEFRRRQEADFWHGVNRFLIFCIVIGLGAFVALAFFPEMRRLQDLGVNLADTQRQVAEEQLLERKLQRQAYLIQNDREYQETVSRDLLELMKEGETIFRLDTTKRAEPVMPRQGN